MDPLLNLGILSVLTDSEVDCFYVGNGGSSNNSSSNYSNTTKTISGFVMLRVLLQDLQLHKEIQRTIALMVLLM